MHLCGYVMENMVVPSNAYHPTTVRFAPGFLYAQGSRGQRRRRRSVNASVSARDLTVPPRLTETRLAPRTPAFSVDLDNPEHNCASSERYRGCSVLLLTIRARYHPRGLCSKHPSNAPMPLHHVGIFMTDRPGQRS